VSPASFGLDADHTHALGKNPFQVHENLDPRERSLLDERVQIGGALPALHGSRIFKEPGQALGVALAASQFEVRERPVIGAKKFNRFAKLRKVRTVRTSRPKTAIVPTRRRPA